MDRYISSTGTMNSISRSVFCFQSVVVGVAILGVPAHCMRGLSCGAGAVGVGSKPVKPLAASPGPKRPGIEFALHPSVPSGSRRLKARCCSLCPLPPVLPGFLGCCRHFALLEPVR